LPEGFSKSRECIAELLLITRQCLSQGRPTKLQKEED